MVPSSSSSDPPPPRLAITQLSQYLVHVFSRCPVPAATSVESGFIVTCPHPQGSLSSTVSYLQCTSYTFLTLSLRRHCFSELCRPPMALLLDGKFSESLQCLLSTGSSSHSSPQGVSCPTCAHSTCTLASRLPPAPGQQTYQLYAACR